MPSKAEEIEAQIEALQEQLAKLRARPEEPDLTDAIIRFEITIPTGRPGRNPRFSYVAHKFRSQWWVGGPGSETFQIQDIGFATGVTWDSLMDWIEKSGGAHIELVTGVTDYGSVTPQEQQNGSAASKMPAARSQNGRARAKERRGKNHVS